MSIDVRALAVIAAVTLIFAAWMLRYQVSTPAPGSAAAYVLVDRLTGTVEFCTGVRCSRVERAP